MDYIYTIEINKIKTDISDHFVDFFKALMIFFF